MGDPGIIVISLYGHEPEAWEQRVRDNPQAQVLEVHIGAAPGKESLTSLSHIAERNGLSLRLRGEPE
jgi:hypothetical protein